MGFVAALAAMLVCVAVSSVRAGTVIEVYASSAPNGYGSPSYAGYVANATYALENGLTSYGDPSLPTYYSQLGSTMKLSDNIVTGFNSWKGQANPSAPFQSELGNRVLFGVHIESDTLFSISQLSFVMKSDDADNSLGYTFGLGGYSYSTQYVGIYYGLDGQIGRASCRETVC